MHWIPFVARVLPRKHRHPESGRPKCTIADSHPPRCASSRCFLFSPPHAQDIPRLRREAAPCPIVPRPQEPQRPQSPAPRHPALSPQTRDCCRIGLLIDAHLDQTLSTARPEGFAFSTQVADAVAAKDGAVAIPAGTVIRGVVVGVRPASGAKPPLICVNLDFLELNGRDYGIRSSVKSVLVNGKPATILPRDSIAKLFPNEPAVALHGTHRRARRRRQQQQNRRCFPPVRRSSSSSIARSPCSARAQRSLSGDAARVPLDIIETLSAYSAVTRH